MITNEEITALWQKHSTNIWDFAHALMAAAPTGKQSLQVPEGYKLVPVELTREMLYAIQNDCDIMPQRGKRIWATLLAVAPTPPEAK